MNSNSINIQWDLDRPVEMTRSLLKSYNKQEITQQDFANFLQKADVASAISFGMTSLVGEVVESAKASQKQSAQNLALGLEQSLAALKVVGDALQTDQARIQYAQIVCQISNIYFATITELQADNNHFWQYLAGGIFTVAIAVLGGREFISQQQKPES